MLTSLARVPYMTRQAKQFQDLFKSREESYDVLTFLYDEAELLINGSRRPEETNEMIRQSNRDSLIAGTKEIYKELTESEIQTYLIPFLQNVLKDSEKVKALRNEFGQFRNNASDKINEDFLLNLLSIFQNKNTLDRLFPINKKSIRSYYKLDGTTIAREVDPFTLRREIKIFEGLSKTGNVLDAFFKDTVIAAQNLSNDAWKVDVVTLGIPELDLPPQELSSRVVVLNVWDERTQSLHWLSGVYQILGLAHAIDPSKGYLTKLKLIKGVV